MLLIVGLLSLAFAARGARLPSGRARWVTGGWVLAGLVCVALGAPRGLALSKSVGLILMPLGLLWTALVGGALYLVVRERWALAGPIGALALALGVAGNEPLAGVALAAVEGVHGRSRPLDEGPTLDAIYILGGATDDRPTGNVRVGASGDRLVLAARLYHLGRSPRLVVSGSPIEGFAPHDSVRASALILTELGVPETSIVRLEGARTTSEEARLYARLTEERGFERVGLVTSAFHMRRALRLFDAEGLEVVPLPADVRGRDFRWRGFYSVVPTGPAAADLHVAGWEWVGALAGR